MAFKAKSLTLIGRMTTRRHLPKELAAPVAEFATQIGEVIWAWNYCHASFGRLFGVLVSRQNLRMGQTLWLAVPNDSTRRDLLLASAQVALTKNKGYLRRIKWAKERVDKLGPIRNDAVHMATGFANYPSDPSIVPDQFGTAPARFRRLANKDLHKMFSDLRGDLTALAGYVESVAGEISFPGVYTLPRRPKLQSLPQLQRVGKKTRTRKVIKRRRSSAS